jgi:hypothetical protein
VNLEASGGHSSVFEGRKVYPVNFLLRHYIVLSRAHAIRKYLIERTYSRQEVEELGWHGERARFDPSRLCFKPASALKCIDDRSWDKSQPWTKHVFFGIEEAH